MGIALGALKRAKIDIPITRNMEKKFDPIQTIFGTVMPRARSKKSKNVEILHFFVKDEYFLQISMDQCVKMV